MSHNDLHITAELKHIFQRGNKVNRLKEASWLRIREELEREFPGWKGIQNILPLLYHFVWGL